MSPSGDRGSFMLDCAEMFLRVSNLSAAGRISSCLTVWSKKLTLCCLNCGFLAFRLTLLVLVVSNTLTNVGHTLPLSSQNDDVVGYPSNIGNLLIDVI